MRCCRRMEGREKSVINLRPNRDPCPKATDAFNWLGITHFDRLTDTFTGDHVHGTRGHEHRIVLSDRGRFT